jgi:hypothetical protein
MPANRVNSEKTLSIKSKLIIIAIMFVIINLIFYVGFDSSDDSEESIKLKDNVEQNIKEQTATEIVISTTP